MFGHLIKSAHQVRSWRFSDLPRWPLFGRFPGWSRRQAS
jgi:hypothetical protein